MESPQTEPLRNDGDKCIFCGSYQTSPFYFACTSMRVEKDPVKAQSDKCRLICAEKKLHLNEVWAKTAEEKLRTERMVFQRRISELELQISQCGQRYREKVAELEIKVKLADELNVRISAYCGTIQRNATIKNISVDGVYYAIGHVVSWLVWHKDHGLLYGDIREFRFGGRMVLVFCTQTWQWEEVPISRISHYNTDCFYNYVEDVER
jgi:hypothetical protein